MGQSGFWERFTWKSILAILLDNLATGQYQQGIAKYLMIEPGCTGVFLVFFYYHGRKQFVLL